DVPARRDAEAPGEGLGDECLAPLAGPRGRRVRVFSSDQRKTSEARDDLEITGADREGAPSRVGDVANAQRIDLRHARNAAEKGEDVGRQVSEQTGASSCGRLDPDIR